MGVSNNLLHRYNMLCIDDLVTVGNDSVGIILSINNNMYVVKNVQGITNTYNRQQIRLSTNDEIENCLRQILTERK